jgi:hypothetical protein
MGFFSRGAGRRRLLTATPADLARIGEQAFGGQSIYPPGIASTALDPYAIAFLEAAGYPAGGSSAEAAANAQFLEELTSAAELAGDWGFVGAMAVAWNCVSPDHRQDPRCLAILDRALEVLRVDGVSYTSVPPFAMNRWQSLHGFDGARPAGWPSALEHVPVPSADVAPPVVDLAAGETRKLAQAPAAPTNTISAERRPDGSVHAVVEGPDPETGRLRCWDWDGLSAADYPSLLRELGERLVTHTLWAHDDLIPYFPCRQRTRDQMRADARAHVFPGVA